MDIVFGFLNQYSSAKH